MARASNFRNYLGLMQHAGLGRAAIHKLPGDALLPQMDGAPLCVLGRSRGAARSFVHYPHLGTVQTAAAQYPFKGMCLKGGRKRFKGRRKQGQEQGRKGGNN